MKKQSRSVLNLNQTNKDQTQSVRDIYNRKVKDKYWIDRANIELSEPDRSDVGKLLTHLHYSDKSSLWIIRYITALLLMRRQLRKPFRNTTREDIRRLLDWMKTKEYKVSRHEKLRIILKSFFKIVCGNNELYPEAVNWFSVGVGRERRSLEENEIKELIDKAPTLQKKAFVACENTASSRSNLNLCNINVGKSHLLRQNSKPFR